MKNYPALLLCLLAGFNEAHALPAVIDNSLYPGAAAPANTVVAGTPASNAMMDLMAKIEHLQSDVRQLTGKVEEQAYQINALQKQQKAHSSDFDERLSNLENKFADPNLSETVTATDSTATDSTATDSAAPETAPPETSPQTAEETPKTPQNPVPATPPAENEAYKQHLDLLRHGRTDEAIAGFQAFLDQYPDSSLAGNAQYWLGEAYRAKRDDVSAIKAFNAVISHYPNSPKVPDALLKLGYMAAEQNQTDQAREYLNRVVNDYPNSQPALLAERKLATLNNH